jgi:hypothetical protein
VTSTTLGIRSRSRCRSRAGAATTGRLAALLSPSAGPSVTLPWYGWTIGLGVNTAVVVALAGWAGVIWFCGPARGRQRCWVWRPGPRSG